MKIVAIVGMAGSGKSEAAKVFEANGFARIRFGDLTEEEIKKRGLPLNEANERRIREALRKEYGMIAYAKLNLPKIETALKKSNVIIDGLYSWEEYLFLKERFGDDFITVAVWAAPETRYERLGKRKIRPLTAAEAASRDRSEIENLHKGGPIAVADFTICNKSSVANLKKETERIIANLI